MVSDFFDLQAGLRQDFRPQPERTYGVIGLHCLVKYFVKTGLAAFVSEKGKWPARAGGTIRPGDGVEEG